MRINLDTDKYNVVMDSSNLDVSINSGAKLDVSIGESSRIDVGQAVTYIKSGKKEIDTYVEGKVKPDILEYSKVESQKFIDAYVGSTVEEYVEEVTKPSINEYTDAKINQYNQNAVSKSDDFNTLAESLTNEYTSLAQTSEESLIQYADSASLSAKNAKDSADVSTAQASISTAQAVISTTKASESLASANASSNYAVSSENSAKASAKSLSDANQVLASTTAQKEIAVSSANAAKESETKAKASETNAKTSETNAKSSELSAKESATSSLASANQSQQSADASSEYASSSKADSESASATLTKVLQSETNVKAYSESAKESSDIAVAKADAAKTSETNAKASEDKATSEATKSENSAKQSQEYSESASQSAENASKSASSAKTSETNASQSATKSAQSEANALSYSQSAKSSSDSASNSVVECQAIKDSLGTIYKFKGSVASVSALPSGASIGDVYDVIDSGNNYAWTGSSWDSLGVNVDLSEYAKKSDLTSKQDKLTAGTGISIDNNVISNTQTSAEWGNIKGTLSNQTDLQNALNDKQATISDLSTIRSGASLGSTALQPSGIKTINGESLVGSGDVEITGGITYEDLNEDVTINPTPIREEWETFRNSIDSIISGYQAQVDALQTELNTVKAVRYVVETWSEGTEWYTVYSDGWCEQGGYVVGTGSNTVTTNYHKEFKSEPTVIKQTGYTGTFSNAVNWIYIQVWDVTTISFTHQLYANTSGGSCKWYACGYIS
jgi:hypothetical protein